MLAGLIPPLLIAAATACGGAPEPPRSIVIVSIDTLRADRLGCYGNAGGLTPSLDRLAAEGVLFEDATAPTPLTLPSHSSLFTGRYPTATGVRNNGTFVLPDAETTLAESLRDEGWETGAVVAAFPLKRRFGLGQGFRIYDEEIEPPGGVRHAGVRVSYVERDARSVTDRAIRVWRGLGGERRFLWVHYFDPHTPYAPPPPFADRHEDPYDGEVAFADAEVGRLLAEIETADPGAVVVLVADHGEGLGEHGEHNHGLFVYQTTLEIPMIVRAPGRLPAGRRISEPVSLVDMMPTVLSLAGVRSPAGIQGADLSTLIDGGPAPERTVYAETHMPRLEYGFSELAAVRSGSLKYIDAPLPELYDLERDPGETRNLHGMHEDEEWLASALDEFLAAADAGGEERAANDLDEEALEKLRSLGYLAGGKVAVPNGERGRDPKDMLEYFDRHGRANLALMNGRFDEAVAMLRELVEMAPENFMIHERVAAALIGAERYAEAERELRVVVSAAPDYADGHRLLAETLARQGKLDEAVASFRAAAEAAPTIGRPLFALGRTLERWGRFEPAAEAYIEAIEREPTEADYSRRLLELRHARGQLDRAAAELEGLAGRYPRAPALWTSAGVARRRLEQPAEALALLERALAIEPHRYDTLIEVGAIQLESGRADVAEEAFARARDVAPGRREALLGLAAAYRALGRRDEARAAYRRLLALYPDDRQGLEGLRRLDGRR